jgi:hypothetical protein
VWNLQGEEGRALLCGVITSGRPGSSRLNINNSHAQGEVLEGQMRYHHSSPRTTVVVCLQYLACVAVCSGMLHQHCPLSEWTNSDCMALCSPPCFVCGHA